MVKINLKHHDRKHHDLFHAQPYKNCSHCVAEDIASRVDAKQRAQKTVDAKKLITDVAKKLGITK